MARLEPLAEAGGGTLVDGRKVQVAKPADVKRMSGNLAFHTGDREQAARVARLSERLGTRIENVDGEGVFWRA